MSRTYEFIYDEELGIEKPILYVPMEQLSEEDQSSLYHKMEQISGQIPERIRELERKYETLYARFSEEDHIQDDRFYSRMEEMNEISRKIGELNILYLQMQGKYLTSYQG